MEFKLSKKEVVVVFAIIVFLLMTLGAAGHKSNIHAKRMICKSNLTNWYRAMIAFTDDNNEAFWQGWFTENNETPNWWMKALKPYYQDNNRMRLCPTATKLRFLEDGVTPGPGYGREPFMAWGYNTWLSMASSGREDNGDLVDYYGSYGINGWIVNAYQNPAYQGPNDSKFWRKTTLFKKPHTIPFLLDAQWVDVWPEPDQFPPTAGDEPWSGGSNFSRVCQNRHGNGVQMAVFMDGTARPVGLKELWTLKWHRNYDTKGPWTLGGGVTRSDWEAAGAGWMADFTDY